MNWPIDIDHRNQVKNLHSLVWIFFFHWCPIHTDSFPTSFMHFCFKIDEQYLDYKRNSGFYQQANRNLERVRKDIPLVKNSYVSTSVRTLQMRIASRNLLHPYPTNANRIERFVASLGSSKLFTFFSEILVVPIF
jgi:hypothetical protein